MRSSLANVWLLAGSFILHGCASTQKNAPQNTIIQPAETRTLYNGPAKTAPCFNKVVTVEFDVKTGKQVSKPEANFNDLGEKCRSNNMLLKLIASAGYSDEDRGNAAGLVLTRWSQVSGENLFQFNTLMDMNHVTPKVMLRLYILDAIKRISSGIPDKQRDGLDRIFAVHRNEEFPKFGDDAPRIVEDELVRKGLTIKDVENDLLHKTSKVYSSLLLQQNPAFKCEPENDVLACYKQY